MPNQVCSGATLSCSFGTVTSTMVVLPTNRVYTSNMPAATINDYIPLVNIMSFTMCTSSSNPQVASTGAPASCVPVVTSAWSPGNTQTQIGGAAIINDTSTCNCMWSGVISVTNAGQTTVQD